MLSRLQAENPEPTTELQYSSVFELLTAMLSAQATDVSVNKPLAHIRQSQYVSGHLPPRRKRIKKSHQNDRPI